MDGESIVNGQNLAKNYNQYTSVYLSTTMADSQSPMAIDETTGAKGGGEGPVGGEVVGWKH